MTRDTSAEAYNHITRTGALGAMRTRAYKLLFARGPLAQFEIEQFEGRKHYGGSLSKRFNELEGMGLVRVVGKKVNPVSNRRCNVYDVTSKLPDGPYKPKPPRVDELALHHLTTLMSEPTGVGVVEGSGTDWGMRRASVFIAAQKELDRRLAAAEQLARAEEARHGEG